MVQYLGIAADEPVRIARHTKEGNLLPLVEMGWDEAYCRQWCEERGLLSPIYTTSSRGVLLLSNAINRSITIAQKKLSRLLATYAQMGLGQSCYFQI